MESAVGEHKRESPPPIHGRDHRFWRLFVAIPRDQVLFRHPRGWDHVVALRWLQGIMKLLC